MSETESRADELTWQYAVWESTASAEELAEMDRLIAAPPTVRADLVKAIHEALTRGVDTGMGEREMLTEIYQPEGVAIVLADVVLSVPAIHEALSVFTAVEPQADGSSQ